MSRHAIIAAVLSALVSLDASAQRILLDDTLSPINTFAVQLSWEPAVMRQALAALLAGAPGAEPPMTGRIANVEVRLDTREHVGQIARIYLTLPASIAGLGTTGDLELQWDVSTPFIPGAARAGQSTLVFEGAIDNIVTSAVFTFLLRLDRGPDTETFALEPYYELEIIR